MLSKGLYFSADCERIYELKRLIHKRTRINEKDEDDWDPFMCARL